jgi:hypothetical protein
MADEELGLRLPVSRGTLRDPLAFSEEIDALPLEDQKLVMGGNLARLNVS